jgi:regulator of protease activity HflC (stomatin/prohibitin superfamily)
VNLRKTLTITGLAVVAVLAVGSASGCTSVSTEPDQVALHYNGGAFSSKTYDSYVGPSKKEWFGPGDKTYVYPIGQRSYDATGAAGSERGPITSSSKDNVELATPVAVTFELIDAEDALRQFHERIGLKYQAFSGDNDRGEDISRGWKRMLNFYVGQPLETTVDRVLAGYTWQQAYSDPNVRVQIETAVKNELPALVDQKMGGKYFDSFAVLVQRPTPTNEELRNNIAAAQNQVAGAQAAKAKAEADLAATKAQIAVQQAEAAKKKADISAYGSVDQYNKAQAIEKGINPYQPTYVVSGTAPNNSNK